MHRGMFLGFILLPLAGTYALEKDLPSIYEGTLETRVDALAEIQPGLGAVMHEFGYRFSRMYWAANGGNWGLAQYELKELGEAQEVAEITRPKRREMLAVFEEKHLSPLEQAIERKDMSEFNERFSAAVQGCNSCHSATGYGFIQYRVPEKPKNELLDFAKKTDPRYKEENEPK